MIFVLLLACTDSGKDSTSGTDSDANTDTDNSGTDSGGTDSGTTDTGGTDTGDTEEPTWSYEGETGPDHWGDLSEEWATCGTGTSQSPVDFVTDSLLPGEDWIEINWAETALHAYNSGHYIRYNVDAGSTVTTANGTFNLKQFHFHGLSEHTIDGAHLEMEVHFVHEDPADATNLLVVAMFIDSAFELGAVPTDLLGSAGDLKFYEAVALGVSETTTDLGGTLDLGTFGAAFGNYAYYDGSLTTPPCDEGVRFYISGNVLKPAPEDTAAFLAVYDYNFRPTQPLNGRVVSYYAPN